MTYHQDNSKPPKRSGFTLLELIIVVVIVGVLAGLALPKMQLMIRRSYITEAMQVFSILHGRMEQAYAMGSGTYVTMFNIMLSNANANNASGPLAVSRPEDAPGAWSCDTKQIHNTRIHDGQCSNAMCRGQYRDNHVQS